MRIEDRKFPIYYNTSWQVLFKYINKYGINDSVMIDSITKIGYVSEFKDKATGEQIYVVTDKRLGENPSIMELASVKK